MKTEPRANTPKTKTPKSNSTPDKKARKRPPKAKIFRDIPERDKRETINDVAVENETECILFENPSYMTALLGYMIDDDGRMRAVYSEERMIEDLMETDGMAYEDAVDFYEYNTIRALPYCKSDKAPPPLIVHTF